MNAKIFRAIVVVFAGAMLLSACQQQAEPEETAVMDLSLESNVRFLAANAEREGVNVLPSGLQYRVIVEGEGEAPGPSDQVTVIYRGWLIDGTVFDQTDPGQTAIFTTGTLIPGWVEALQLMQEGDEWEIVLPHYLAYGAQGAGDGLIPPYQTLAFNMQLLAVNSPP